MYMTAKNEISEELRMLSEVVAGISRVTPYSAPGTGYFEMLPDQLLSQVNPILPTVLQGVIKSPPFEVPAGYFEDLASNILNRVRASDELKELSPLLSGIGKKLPFQAPEGYFNSQLSQLAGSAMTTSAGEEESEEGWKVELETEFSSLLTGLQQAPTYQVPEGYFGQFPDRMLARVGVAAKEAKAPSARVISMGRKQQWWKLPAVAAAASVILIVGWLSLHTPGSKTGNPAGNPDITKSLSNVSDQDIQNYLDNQNIPLADQLANSTASVDITDNDENNMLGDVSDAELKQYLEDHGNAKDLPKN